MLFNRVYFATPLTRGRKPAHAASTRAWAARIVSIDCFAAKLVSIARCPTWSAVSPPGVVRRRSSGTAIGVVDAGVTPGASSTGAGRTSLAPCASAFAPDANAATTRPDVKNDLRITNHLLLDSQSSMLHRPQGAHP